MVIMFDGSSEIGAHVRSNLCFSICLIGSRLDRDQSEIDFFLSLMRARARACSELPSNISTMCRLGLAADVWSLGIILYNMAFNVSKEFIFYVI